MNTALKWIIILLVTASGLVLLLKWTGRISEPLTEIGWTTALERTILDENIYICEESWLKMNPYGLWEMYLKGGDLELGVKNGILACELIHWQEVVFIAGIREMVPSDVYLRFLKQVVLWMNRNLDEHIPIEFQREIYGVSRYASDTFAFIGPAYQRILNYHAAHDIGHSLQNMNLVACTAIGVTGSRSEDGTLLVGRNFDFSMGDDFARNKIIAFYEPEKGYRFASVTWGGMIGVVSGMNDQGLVVTLNAAKSGIPGSAKTPTSILARQILQYASNIEEAFEIAGSAETFVAESFLVSSAKDGKTVVIEKSPDSQSLYDPLGEVLILTNHFQSEFFENSRLNLKNKAEGSSVYRWQRSLELVASEAQHDEASFARILRDQDGMGGKPIGMGNEKAVNQLIAHHSVIFKPGELKMWISTHPYQLGRYLCYDLDVVFSDTTGVTDRIFIEGEEIGPDPFLRSAQYQDFIRYKKETERLRDLIGSRQVILQADDQIADYLEMNPDYYYPYYIAGEIYRLGGNLSRARELYERSLSLEIPRRVDREQVEEALKK
jgi:hypothetical protein